MIFKKKIIKIKITLKNKPGTDNSSVYFTSGTPSSSISALRVPFNMMKK